MFFVCAVVNLAVLSAIILRAIIRPENNNA